MLCKTCKKNKAVKHDMYGYLECESCQKKLNESPRKDVEFTTDSIREGRSEYSKDILQPYQDGVLSKEYLDEYGVSGINVTKQEIKDAKYTNKGLKNWWGRNRSKGGRSFKVEQEEGK